MIDNIKDLYEFKKTLNGIEVKFWKGDEQIKHSLKEKGLL